MCDGAIVFWCLVPLRFRQTNYPPRFCCCDMFPAHNIWLMTSHRSSFMIAQLCEENSRPSPSFSGAFFRPPACMARYIFVCSNGYSSIPSYEVCCSQWTNSINFPTLASFTSIVSYMFRRKVVSVCAVPLGVVCICPVPSLKQYMVRSARRRFV